MLRVRLGLQLIIMTVKQFLDTDDEIGIVSINQAVAKLLYVQYHPKINCFVLTFDPAPKNAIPRWCNGREWDIPMAVGRGNRVGGNWLMKWDKVIPMVHYRVMHRKRVTSELHDSYFRLMTIKHSISKIEWASNDYIIELSSTSQLNWVLVPVEFDAQRGSWVEDRTEL